MDLVSIIIPAYNAGKWISETLDSVLDQTYPNYEILVIDDGSTDETATVVRSYAQKDERIKLLQQPNQGVAAARNHGLSKAQGEFIALLDADDLWLPSKLDKQVHLLKQSNTSIGLIYCWSALIDEQSNWNGGYIAYNFTGWVEIALRYSNFIGNASSPLIRRSVLNEVGNFDLSFHQHKAQGCEDWDFYLRIACRYQFEVIPEALVGYRQLPSAMSRDHLPMLRSFHLVTERHSALNFSPILNQWSEGLFLIHIAFLQSCPKNWNTSIHLLWEALQKDPAVLLKYHFYKVIFNIFIPRGVKPQLRHLIFQLKILLHLHQAPVHRCSFWDLKQSHLQASNARPFIRILLARINQVQTQYALTNQIEIGRQHASL